MHGCGGGTCAWRGWRGHAATNMQGVATYLPLGLCFAFSDFALQCVMS
jgi:hypothetical protein